MFFISYTVIASFLIFNLFIGIVLNSMEEARSADNKEHESDDLLGTVARGTDRLGAGRAGTAENPPRRLVRPTLREAVDLIHC